MRLTKLGFKGFKSLKGVDCELGHVTVVTGPNGAGKTNFVEALSLMSESLQYGLEISVARAGGYENIAHKGEGREPVQVECIIEAELQLAEIAEWTRHYEPTPTNLTDTTISVSYSFAIDHPADADPWEFQIASEFFELRDEHGYIVRIRREGPEPPKFLRSKRMKGRKSNYGAALYPLSDDSFVRFVKARADEKTLVLAAANFTGTVFDLLARSLSQVRVFQLSPQQCRQSGVSTPNAVLSRYGENLPSVVDFLKRHRSGAWSHIERAMHSVLPQLDSIDTTFTQDRKLALVFKDRESDREWNANEVSDGTVQALALFVALFDERSPILVVEEPENALHPWILRQFLNLCHEQENKQILLTTHSPIVIDYTPPSDLRIMWSRSGESHLAAVETLDPTIVRLWKSGEVRSFDIYDSGLLHEYLPEEYVPEGPG